MTALTPRGYRFRTPSQWSSCLFDRVEQAREGAAGRLQPIATFEHEARLYETQGAHAPAATRAGEILWRDDVGRLHRLTACDDEPHADAAPYPIAHAQRLVAATSGLWLIDPLGSSLLRFDAESLTRLAVLNVDDSQVIDIASDGYDKLFALVEREGIAQALRINCSGRVVAEVVFESISSARAFVYLRRSQRFVVLTGGADPHLYWFAEEGGAALTNMRVAAMHRCFSGSALGSDARTRVLLVGTDDGNAGGKSFVLILDGDGASLGEVPLDARDSPASGVTATRDALLVTGPRGLLRYSLAKVVPDGTAEVRCSLLTPWMQSPERADRSRWLRIEAMGNVPAGAAIEISYAATADAALRNRLAAIAADPAVPASHRVQRLIREPGIWSAPLVFHGSGTGRDGSSSVLSAPLVEVREPYVRVRITLVATAGGSLPALSELVVLYPGQTLMDGLPAIYRRADAQPYSFLRSLVGVLEATTQGLDVRIAAMAAHIHPCTAPPGWLDFIARWLGVPWDDALSDAQKKRIVGRASDLARGRGTRAGLEALLESLMPERPRRFRITDPTADFGFATVGGEACRGSELPALLGRRTPWNTELDASAVLGRMRLPCDGSVDDGLQYLTGHVRVDIAASGEERRAWGPWLVTLINEMVPLTARVQLRWVSAQALRGARLDGSLVLEAPPMPHLGGDAILGVARLPERGSRITVTGADIGTRLQ